MKRARECKLWRGSGVQSWMRQVQARVGVRAAGRGRKVGVALFLCVVVALLVPILALGASAFESGQAQNGSSPATQTFGKTSVGASAEVFAANRKRVNRYALPVAGSVTKLSIYLAPSSATGQQVLEGVVYGESGGAPGALLGSSSPLTFASTDAAGWYDLTFTTPLNLVAGNYWIGVLTGATADVAGYRYDSVTGSRDYNTNTYTSGPTNPFGSVTTDSQQMSLYATYTPSAPVSRPVEETLPTISGTPQSGQELSAEPGSWTESPTEYAYQWLRCNAAGEECKEVATGQKYRAVPADVGSTLRVAVTASNSAGPSAAAATSAQTAVVSSLAPPFNTTLPVVSGTPQAGRELRASTGAWTENPTAFTYQWQRCNEAGEECEEITLATSETYTATPTDVGHRLRVQVTAANAEHLSVPATSAPSPVVAAAPAVEHLEYVFNNGLISVYDIDTGFKLVKTISLPQTDTQIRGVTVSPVTHMLFISYGGDGGSTGNGSVLAYDLVGEKVVWTVNLKTGIDSGMVSPDGKLLYMPTGENTPSGIWNIVNTSNGAIVGTIQGGAYAHNTVVSNDGNYVYLGGRQYNYLGVYEKSTGKVRYVGPLVNTVRPFTVNGSNTLAFTSATNFDGFQVSSITTGKVLYTVSFGSIPSGFPISGPSHGVSLSPDEKQLYVIDSVHKEVQVYDVEKVAEGVAPTLLGVVPVAGLSGTESGCVYDCGRGGWVQRSVDGRYVFVADSGDVIETATRKVIANLVPLLNTKMSLEVDWENGVPIATSGRTGVGQVP